MMTSKDLPREDSPRYNVLHSKQDLELEALRQRGLTTLLNRHFTEAIRQVANEKAATDAAQKDLEHRRARAAATRTKNPSKVELSPLDAMCLKVNRWQKETRRKERETLLMYQRYVDTFGKAGQVQKSKCVKNVPNRFIKSTGPKQNIKKATNRKGYTHNGYAAVYNEILNEVTALPVTQLNQQDTTNNTGNRDTDKLCDETCAETTPEATIAPSDNHDSLSCVPNSEDHFLLNDRNQHEDALAKRLSGDNSCENRPAARQALLIEDDMLSICSGLTLSSEQTRQVLQECEDTVARFLLREQMQVLKLMEAEEDDQPDMTMTSFNDESTVVSTRVADQAEMIAKKMKSILNEFEVHSERKSDKDGVLAIAPDNEGRRVETCRPEEEWFAYYDDYYRRDYFHERKTNRTQWEHPDDCTATPFSTVDVLVDIDEIVGMRQTPSIFAAYKTKLRKSRKRRRYLWIGFCFSSFLIGVIRYFSKTDQLISESIVNLPNDIQISSVEEVDELISVHTQADKCNDEQQEIYQNVSQLDKGDHEQCVDFLEAFTRAEIILGETANAPVQIMEAAHPVLYRILSSMSTQYRSAGFPKTAFDMESFVESIMQ